MQDSARMDLQIKPFFILGKKKASKRGLNSRRYRLEGTDSAVGQNEYQNTSQNGEDFRNYKTLEKLINGKTNPVHQYDIRSAYKHLT